MPNSQRNLSARRRFPGNLSQLLLPLVLPQTHRCKFLIHRFRILHVNCHPPEREDSIQKRQRPAEVNTVSTMIGVYSVNEIATLTEDHQALHTAKHKELLNVDKIWCGGGARQTAIATSSLATLGTEATAGCIPHTMRILARGFEQIDSLDAEFCAGAPKLTTLRGFLTIAAMHRNSVAFGDCHSAFHQSPMSGEDVF